MSEIRAQILLAGVLIASLVTAGFWLQGLSKLKISRLITENPILHISTAERFNLQLIFNGFLY